MAEWVDGPVVMLSQLEARIVAALIAPGAEQFAQRNGGMPPEVAALIGELRRRTGNAQVSGSPRTGGDERILIVASSAPIDVAAAARRLGVHQKTARELCRRKVLKGDKDLRGEWRIDPASVDAEAARRSERTSAWQSDQPDRSVPGRAASRQRVS